MKYGYWTGLALAAGMAALTGCGGNQKGTVTGIKVGVVVYDQYDTFVAHMINVLNDYATQKEEETGVAINIEVLDASGSQSTQNEQVRTLIEKECDVICVNLVDRTEPTTITDMAEKNDVPIIFFNRELVAEDLERWDQLYYVGADAFQSGIMQGELAAEAFEADPSLDKNGDGVVQYIVLEGEAGHQDAIVRTEYSINTLTEQGVQVEKLGYAIANWMRAQAQTQTASMLTEFEDQIELILANNDDMALGAIDALKAAGISKEDWPVVIGIDGTPVGLYSVQNHEMTATVYNDGKGQAMQMLDLGFALATDAPLSEIALQDEKYIRLPYAKVTSENVEEFLIQVNQTENQL